MGSGVEQDKPKQYRPKWSEQRNPELTQIMKQLWQEIKRINI